MSEQLDTQVPEPVALPVRVDGQPQELTIRPARREEMDKVAEMVRSSADWYRPFVDEKDMAEHDVDEDWKDRNFELRDFYIGEVDGVAVGTISTQSFGDFAYLGYIYLYTDHVGKGYGQALMKFAEEVVRRQGHAGMCLIAHPKATWAKKAYLKYGFEIIETERDNVLAWEDGVLQPYYEEGFELYLYSFEDA